jgi:hypothetical protein
MNHLTGILQCLVSIYFTCLHENHDYTICMLAPIETQMLQYRKENLQPNVKITPKSIYVYVQCSIQNSAGNPYTKQGC